MAMIASVMVALLSLAGTWLATRAGIRAVGKSRDEDATLEHRRWMRERRTETYLDVYAFIEWRRYMRSLSTSQDPRPKPELANPISKPATILFAQTKLFGSQTVRELLEASLKASDEVTKRQAQYEVAADRMSSGGPQESLMPLFEQIQEAKATADESDRALLDQLALETYTPTTASKYPMVSMSPRPDSGQTVEDGV